MLIGAAHVAQGASIRMSSPRSSARRGVGERADRDDVDAGLGDRAHGLEGHAAGCLDRRAAGDLRDARAQVVEREVVEHDRADAGGEHGLDLLEPVDLDLDVRGVGEAGHRALERRGDRDALLREHREVVVLGHDGVRQRVAVVVAAAVHARRAARRRAGPASSCGCRRCGRRCARPRRRSAPVSVAMPDIRCAKLSPMRSAVSTPRAGPVTTASTAPGSNHSPSSTTSSTSIARIGQPERGREHLAAAETRRARGRRDRRARSRVSAMRYSLVRSPQGASSSSAAATTRSIVARVSMRPPPRRRAPDSANRRGAMPLDGACAARRVELAEESRPHGSSARKCAPTDSRRARAAATSSRRRRAAGSRPRTRARCAGCAAARATAR